MTTPDPFATPSGPPLRKEPQQAPDAPSYGWPPGHAPAAGYGPPPAYGPPPLPGQVPPPYGEPGPRTSGTAVAALVLAVSSFLVFPLVPAVVALVLARSASEEIRASGGRLTGEGLVTGARWTAWIHLALCAGAVLVVLLLLGVFGVLATS